LHVTRVPKARKPAEQLRRRNRPEEWVALPSDGCKVAVPAWPTGQPSLPEKSLWNDLWALPIAAWWHEQHIARTVVARYVRLSVVKPEHATVGQLERELGLTPASMLRLRVTVEAPEAELEARPDPYAHLKQGRVA
jgi:hypothetical protein